MKTKIATLAATLLALSGSVALAQGTGSAPAGKVGGPAPAAATPKPAAAPNAEEKPAAAPTAPAATPATKPPTGQTKDAGSPAQNDVQNRINRPGPTQPAQPNVLPSPNNPLQQQGASQQYRGTPQTETHTNQALPGQTQPGLAQPSMTQPSTAQPGTTGRQLSNENTTTPRRSDANLNNSANSSSNVNASGGINGSAANLNGAANENGRTGRQHTAMRPSDLRGPDIGLWFDRRARDGLTIADVATTGPIARLGFREGDRIVSVNGRHVATEPEFLDFLLGSAFVPGEGLAVDAVNPAVAATPVDVVVTRDGQEQTIQVDPNLLLADYGVAAPVDPLEQFGVVLDDRVNDQAVVWKVLPRSPAYYAGLRSGDVLTTFHDRPIRGRTDFESTIVGTDPGEASVQVRRGERTRDFQVDVPRFEQREGRTAMRPSLNSSSSENRSDENRTQSQENRSERDNAHPDPFRANH
jgi:hypothetical protein